MGLVRETGVAHRFVGNKPWSHSHYSLSWSIQTSDQKQMDLRCLLNWDCSWRGLHSFPPGLFLPGESCWSILASLASMGAASARPHCSSWLLACRGPQRCIGAMGKCTPSLAWTSTSFLIVKIIILDLTEHLTSTLVYVNDFERSLEILTPTWHEKL